MEVRYRREMNHNYMILDASEQAAGYECRMLADNQIEGLLKFRLRFGEEKQEFYYEITSRQPLRRIFEKRKATGEEIRRVLMAVVTAVSRIEEYLLKEEQLLLEPDYIYVEPDSFMVELCLFPGYTCDWSVKLSELLKFLLERADHQDKDGIVLAYNLYQESLKENYGAADLLKYLSPAADQIFKEKDSEKEKKTEIFHGEEAFIREEDFTGEHEKKKVYREKGYGEKGDEIERYEKDTVEEADYGKNISRKYTDGENAEKKNKILMLWKGLCLLAVLEAVIWYLTGIQGLRIYGIMAAGIVFFIFSVRILFHRSDRKNSSFYSGSVLPKKGCAIGDRERNSEFSQTIIEKKSEKPKKRSSKTTEVAHKIILQEQAGSTSLPDAGTSLWQLQTESEEAYQSRVQQREEEEMRKSREEGTVLLTEKADNCCIGILDPLNRDGEAIQITYVPFTIGKHPQLTDYCLSCPTVSRLHLRIDKKEDVCILTDLNSTNGTVVNGYELQSNETVSVKSGDTIYLADVGFRFYEQR